MPYPLSLFETFAAAVHAHRMATGRSCREISIAAGVGSNWLGVALRRRVATIACADKVLAHILKFEPGESADESSKGSCAQNPSPGGGACLTRSPTPSAE